MNYPFMFAQSEDDTPSEKLRSRGGELQRDEVFDAMVKVRGVVEDCFDGFGNGKLTLKFVISPSGTVHDVEAAQLSFIDVDEKSAVSAMQCVRSIAQELRFRPTGTSTPVTFPFVFNR